MKELTLCLPSGIGDVSWVLSKLVNALSEGYEFNIQIADGWPRRTVEFLKLFPWIKNASYDDFSYVDIVDFSQRHKLDSWDRISNCGFGRIFISPNLHLERGHRLEEWLPDLDTDFHYYIPTSETDSKKAQTLLNGWNKIYRVYGISAASYRGSEAWRTWQFEEWKKFLTLWREFDRDARFILMGGVWDDLTRDLCEILGDRCIDAVGRTSFGTAIEIHRKIDGYVGFSSGLGIIRTVLDRRTFMLWPNHQIELSTSWAPPKMLESGTYVASQWLEPGVVMRSVKQWLKK